MGEIKEDLYVEVGVLIDQSDATQLAAFVSSLLTNMTIEPTKRTKLQTIHNQLLEAMRLEHGNKG